MNIEAYNLDTLRKLVRKLEKENQSLKEKLKEANIHIIQRMFSMNFPKKTQSTIWIRVAEL